MVKTNRLSAPLMGTINITERCNFKCPYCFYQNRSKGDMSMEDFNHVLDEFKSNKIFWLTLSGGEPFLHPLVNEMIESSHRSIYNVMILSNGSVIDNSHLSTIEKVLESKGKFPIQISLDSVIETINKKTRSQYNKVLENIEKLSKIGANLNIATVINSHNYSYVVESIETLSKFTKHFHVMPFKEVKQIGELNNDLSINESTLNRVWDDIETLTTDNNLSISIPERCIPEKDWTAFGAPCLAAFTQIVVDPDLNVRPCDRVIDFSIGNLSKNSLKEVWNSNESEQVYSQNIPQCKKNWA